APYKESVDKMKTSSAGLYAIFTGQSKEIEAQSVMLFVNVIDLGRAHILALEAPEAGNKRILTCSDKPYNNKQIADAFINNFPDLARNTPTKLPEGVEADGYPTGGYYRGDNALSKRILGMTYYDIEQTMVQFVNSVKDYSPLECNKELSRKEFRAKSLHQTLVTFSPWARLVMSPRVKQAITTQISPNLLLYHAIRSYEQPFHLIMAAYGNSTDYLL
ncbi:9685_t:CDS:2, partial [Acaulospora colombiana]